MSEEVTKSELVAPPNGSTTNWLWRVLVVGLIFLVALGFVLAFALNAFVPTADASPFITLGTAALTGLLGLFVTPTKAS